MKLSDEAIKDLSIILAKETGGAINLNQDELNEIGELLLTVLTENLKMRSNKQTIYN